MRILVVGNGFDIEHGLRTKYPQFMDFVRWLNVVDTEPEKYTLNDEDIAIYKRLVKDKPDVVAELKNHVNDNIWIRYFERIRELNKETWIDFESEIASIVSLFDKGRKDYLSKASFYTDQETPSYDIQRLDRAFLRDENRNTSSLSGISLDRYRNRMISDLKKLTRALEIYIEYWVECAVINNMNPDIARIHPNKVISFNYTHTFDRIYRKNSNRVEYCYIHGEAKGETIQDNNMVLGIDDYLRGGEPEDGYFIGFKKYYQRLELNTDTSYLQWIEEIKDKKNENSEIYIFGHSLDVTDKEVFKPLLNIDNAKTTVYCYDKEARSKLIANVIKLIGKTKAIQKINAGQIVFVLQAKSMTIENSELEVNSDIHDLYGLSKLSFDEIESLLDKIKTKINEKNVEYFSDLSFVISVVDALASYNLYNSVVDEEKIHSIIKEIAAKKKYDGFYITDEWVDFSPDGQPLWRPEMVKTVKVINDCINDGNIKELYGYEQIFNVNNINMTQDKYLEIFEKAYRYFNDNRRFDENAITYLGNLFRGNTSEANRALKVLKGQVDRHENYISPYGEVFYNIMRGLIEQIGYDEYIDRLEIQAKEDMFTQ